ncbi:MAG: ATP-binding protein [bacterium]
MIRAARLALERVSLANKAVLLLGTFGVSLAFIFWQAWSTSNAVARDMAEIRVSRSPALERTRDLVTIVRGVAVDYEQAVLLGERALIRHNQEEAIRFRKTARALATIPGNESSAASLLKAFDRYNDLALRLSNRMLDTEDVLPPSSDIAEMANEARVCHDRLSAMLAAQQRAQEEAVTQAMNDVERRVSALSACALWTMVPVVLIWVIAFTYVRFRVVVPLTRLARVTGQVAQGDLQAGTVRIPAAEDEIGKLVTGFGAMAEGLLHTTVSKEFLGNIVDAIGEAVIVVDSDRRIRRVNQSAARLLGWSEAEMIGQALLRFAPEADAAVLGLPGSMPPSDARASALTAKDGTAIPVSLSVSPLPLNDGTEGAVVVARDIREALRAENERKDLEQRLYQSAKLESVGQLAAGIAHEINTPTQYVSDNTHFLKSAFQALLGPVAKCQALVHGNGEETPTREATEELRQAITEAKTDYLLAEIPRAIEQTLEGVDRVATIVRAMKEFSHPGSEKTSTDLNRAIATTVTVARNEWKYVADVETALDPNLRPVECIAGELNQVILNMVVNAAHAIADVGDKGRKGLIRIVTRDTEQGAEIEITDNGKGIPASIRPRIFDPFFTTKAVGKGTGQGLAIAHSVICRKHGGTIDVESVEGRGTTFRIRIPRSQPAPQPLDAVIVGRG